MTDRESEEQAILDQLGRDFLRSLADKDAGRLDDAESTLRDILRTEPRLPEPHLELGRILLDTDRLGEAETHAREGLSHLETAGPWTDDLPDTVVMALAHALLAEVLRRRADEDDVVFGDPATFQGLLDESRRHFDQAAALDPSDAYSSYHAFFLGVPGAALPGDAPAPEPPVEPDA